MATSTGHGRNPVAEGRMPWRRILLNPACVVVLAIARIGVADAGELTDFAVEVIDATASGDCKALADIDGDGRDDAVIGDSRLTWYRAPEWTAKIVATANSEFTTDMEAADVDGDGDIDLIVPDGTAGVYWFENRSAGATWTRHFIAATSGRYCHDVAVGDIDADGDLDVVGRPLDGNLHIFRQDVAGGWTATTRTTTGGEGLALADLDRDGRLDIVVNGQWHEAPSGDILTGTWVVHAYDTSRRNTQTKVAVADLNDDGRDDIALTPSESIGEIAWYAAPADPTAGSWPKQVLLASADRYHSLQLADLDGDGHRDLVTAQMHTASTGPVAAVYLNPGVSGGAWPREVIAQVSSHNMAVGDIDHDGRMDLLGCDYIGFPPARVWHNETPGPAGDPSLPRMALSLEIAPNPFNARVRLIAAGDDDRPATVRIHDLRGHLVRVLLAEEILAAPRSLIWDGRDRNGRAAPAGVYIAVLSAGDRRVARKLVLVE